MSEQAPAPPRNRRLEAWLRDDPEELRRAAEDWRRLGFSEYAEYLEAWARGERPPFIPPPW